MFDCSLVIGLGLIGGSIAKALRYFKLSTTIDAVDTCNQSLAVAKKQQIIDNYIDINDNISKYDLIVIACPISQLHNTCSLVFANASINSTIFDISSLKDFSSFGIKQFVKNFVACHPIAGSEKSGFSNSCQNLFSGKNFIICSKPTIFRDKVVDLVNKIGAKPIFLDNKEHDKIYALVSHLPQFLSFASKQPQNLDNFFWQKAFRLNNSNQQIWQDIFYFNQKNIAFFYDKLIINLSKNNLQLQLKQTNSNVVNFDQDFILQNFTIIFWRLLLVIAYNNIDEIALYKHFAGSGYADFTSIMQILDYFCQKPDFWHQIIMQNSANIAKLSYEFTTNKTLQNY